MTEPTIIGEAPVNRPATSIHDIELFASKLSAIPIAELRGPSRARIYIRPRMVIAYFARQAGHNYSQIGKVICRDHSSVINLVQKAHDWRGKDKLFDRLMARMEAAIEAGEVAVPMVKVKPRILVPMLKRKAEAHVKLSHDELNDLRGRDAMRRGSEKLLNALRAAA